MRLVIALLLIGTLAFQGFAATNENQSGPKNSQNFLSRFGFKELLDASFDRTDPTKTVANLISYYIDGRVFSNIIQALFTQADTSSASVITAEQFYTLTDGEGVHRLDAQRVFYLVQSDADANTLDFFEFSNLAEILLDESLTMVVWAYIVGGPQHSEDVTIDLATLESNIEKIWDKVPSVYPQPRCEELEYLYAQSDVDQDGRLDIQEFHYLLGTFLRYYKSGVQNNRYASLVFNDEMFQELWKQEAGLGGHLDKTKFLRLSFLRFLQVSIYDKILNQVSHVLFNKFDIDGSGNISKEEFKLLLTLFRAPENEISLLFVTADSDQSGSIDFAEFVVTLETFLRRLIADFGFYFLSESDMTTNVDSTYQLFQNATGYLNLEFLPKDEFTNIFNGVDADKNQVLDKDEFATFISEIIAFLRTKIRLQEEAEITSVAGLNATSATISQAAVVREEGLSERANEVTSDLLADSSTIATEVIQAVTAGTPASESLREGQMTPEEIEQAERMSEAIEEVYTYKAQTDAEAEAMPVEELAPAGEAAEARIADVISTGLAAEPTEPITPAEGTFIVGAEAATTEEAVEAAPAEAATTEEAVEAATTTEEAVEAAPIEAATTEEAVEAAPAEAVATEEVVEAAPAEVVEAPAEEVAAAATTEEVVEAAPVEAEAAPVEVATTEEAVEAAPAEEAAPVEAAATEEVVEAAPAEEVAAAATTEEVVEAAPVEAEAAPAEVVEVPVEEVAAAATTEEVVEAAPVEAEAAPAEVAVTTEEVVEAAPVEATAGEAVAVEAVVEAPAAEVAVGEAAVAEAPEIVAAEPPAVAAGAL